MNSDIVSPMQGTVLFIDVEIGDDVVLGAGSTFNKKIPDSYFLKASLKK